MKVIGYLRVSTAEQEQSGLGLEAQRDKVTAYCGLYELDLVDVAQDAASGKSIKGRDALAAALARIAAGEAEGLVVAKLDRLTRSVKDLGYLIERYFQKHSLFVVAEQVDTRTASGRLVLNLLVSVAQWERERIGERTAEAFEVKRRRGEKTGGAVPFGYNLVAGKLVENTQEQVIIRLIDDLRSRGHGYKAIAKELNNRGYTTKQGAAWKQMTVKNVINRKRR